MIAVAIAVAPAPVRAGPTVAQRAAHQHYEKAVTHFNLGEFADAVAAFREVYKAAPQAALLGDAAQSCLRNDAATPTAPTSSGGCTPASAGRRCCRRRSCWRRCR
jgi:hypothetical protein